MQVPALEKVVLNMGVGETTQDTKKINSAFEDMQAIAGQKPVITRARLDWLRMDSRLATSGRTIARRDSLGG